MKYKLGDICEIVSGSTPKTGIPEYWDGDKKWITPAEINEESYIITDSARKLTELGVKKTGLSPFPDPLVKSPDWKSCDCGLRNVLQSRV